MQRLFVEVDICLVIWLKYIYIHTYKFIYNQTHIYNSRPRGRRTAWGLTHCVAPGIGVYFHICIITFFRTCKHQNFLSGDIVLLSIANANLAFLPQSSYQPTCETKCNYIDIPRVLPNCMGDTACLLIVHDRFCAIVLSLSSLIFQCIIMCICIFFRIRTFNAVRNWFHVSKATASANRRCCVLERAQ